MFIRNSMISLLLFGAASAFLPHNALAQSNPDKVINSENQQPLRTRIKRKVEPIPYWIDTNSLRVRDNPVAGDVVGLVEFGQKIKAYAQFENWVRISPNGQNAQWLNSDYLSNTPLTWANFNRSNSSGFDGVEDVRLVRIKIPKDKKRRVFAVRVKSSDTGNRIIATKQRLEAGVYFEKRFISCDDNDEPIGVRVVGEGFNYLDMENDRRSQLLDVYSDEQITDQADGKNKAVDNAVAAFACASETF